MFLSSVVDTDTFNFELLKEREFLLMKTRTLHCEIQRLKTQTMIETLLVHLIRNVLINAKIYIGTIWGKLLQRNLSNFKDPLGFSKTVFYQNHIISRRFSKLFF